MGLGECGGGHGDGGWDLVSVEVDMGMVVGGTLPFPSL